MSKDHRSRPVLEVLEPRILYSADLAPIAADLSVAAPFIAPTLATSASVSQIESTQSSPSANTAARPSPIELAVVDTAVAGADALIADIEAQQQAGRPILIVRVDAGEDGISAVSNALAELQASEQPGAPAALVSAIHLIGHGDTNGTVLGDTRLDMAALRLRALEFANWTPALTADADILLYGCDIAGTGSGQLLAQGLAQLTGADVAASNDLTGHANLGGDWILEYAVGDVTTASAISIDTQETWYFTLDITTGLELLNTFNANANDTSGNGYNGTLTNGAAIDTTSGTNKIDGGKTSLDGADDYVDLSAHVANFGTMTTGTIAAWVYTDVTGSVSVVFEASDSVDFDSRLAVIRNGDEFQLFVREGATILLDGTTTTANITPGTWNHVAITVDATGNKIYVNGVQQTVSYLTGSASSNQFFDDVNQLNFMAWGIDHYSTTAFGSPFDGFLDDGRIYNRALSGTDITELYNYAGGPLNYTVTNTNNSGVGSLRWAIDQANASTGTLDTIDFNISGTGVHTINLASALPTITDAVILDATTDDSFAANGNRPAIVLDGSSAFNADGLTLAAGSSGSTLRGLNLQGFTGFNAEAIRISSNNNLIAGNWIGLNAAGTAAAANNAGISIDGSNNLIGGTAAADRNVIAGNTLGGINIDALAATGNVVSGNYIGTDAGGTSVVANASYDVRVNDATGTVIGGTAAGAGNLIASSGPFGIGVTSAATATSVLGNSIFGHSGPGIDLGANGITANDANDVDSGPNGYQNFPVLTTARTNASNQLILTGTLNSTANSYYRIEFFANTSQDGTGYGEGQTYLGFANVATDGSGNATISTTLAVNVAVGSFISATATKATDNTCTAFTDTSEFARNIAAVDSTQATISVDTATDTSDGDTTSLSSLLANKGADGFISLREAIIAANNTANGALADRIVFNIGSGAQTITLTGAELDAISQAVIIDGTTQSGFAGTPLISVIDGDSRQFGFRLWAGSDGSTVRGFNLQGFGTSAVSVTSSNNLIAGNYIGTDAAGTAPAANLDGINIWSGDNNVIGGTNAADRNVISGQTNSGIVITGNADNTQVLGNYLGLNAAGTTALGNFVYGIYVADSVGTVIGGTSAGARNVVAGNGYHGIYFNNADNSFIYGNYVGTNAAGTADVNGTGSNTNQSGIVLANGSSANKVGNAALASSGNVVSGNNWQGIEFWDATTTNNTVEGNYLGTDYTGTASVGNTMGGVVFWASGTGNVVGGNTTAARNIISGNLGGGVVTGGGANGAIIQGNYIGLAVDGTTLLGNAWSGVEVLGASTNALIGTNGDGNNDANERNVISGNWRGITASSATASGTVIAGNYIGTDATGTVARANTTDGIVIESGANNTTIGGTLAAQRNLVSGNGGQGINVDGATTTGTLIQGNYIGVDASGVVALGNGANGIKLASNTGTTIGGTAPAAANVIAGNTNVPAQADGIYVTGGGSHVIQGNYIGVGADGVTALGNYWGGVSVSGISSAVLVGGATPGAGNLIANNGYGVDVSGGAAPTTLLGNSIYANSQLGFDLTGDGVTANDAGDADTGSNNLQNFPVLAAARTDGGSQLVLNGTFNSSANSFYRIEFFSTTLQDGTGHGEGQTYLGFANVATDGSGNATISTTLTVSVAAGSFISATATQSDATYSLFTDTSEFAQNVLATVAPTATNLSAAETYIENTPLTLTDIVITDPDSASVTATLTLSNPAAGSLNTATAGAATSTYSTGTGVWSASGSVADVNTLLAGLTFTPTTGFNAAFSIATSVSDGDGAPITGTKAVTGTAVNNAPVVTGSALDVNYTENNPVGIDVGISITDADSPSLTGATVRISAGYVNGEDQLYFTNQAGISGVWNAGSGTLTLSGTASVAVYQTALRSIAYDNVADAPGTTARTVEWVVSDGTDNSAAVYRDIVVNAVNDAPSFGNLNGAPTYVEGGAAVLLDVDVQVFDAELAAADNYNGATLTLSRNGGATAEDQFVFDGTNVNTSGANVLVGGVQVGNFTFTGGQLVVNLSTNATQARVHTLMQNLLYFNSSATPPGSVVLDWVFSDNNSGAQGSGGTLTANGSTTVIVTAVNDAPAITTTGGVLAYAENDIATPVDAGLTVVDADSANLTGATVLISANFVSGEDLLAFTDQLGITGNWNASTGTLTLSGSSTVANYQSALRSITYFNSSDAPGTTTRTVSFVVNDGAANSSAATRDISVAAVNDTPTLSLPAAQNVAEDTNLVFSIAGGNPISLGDIDAGANPVQMTLSVANGVLSLAGTAGLTFSTGTGSNDTTMSFTGSLASINAALDGLMFRGNADYAGADSLALQIDDLGNTGALGPLSANAAIAIAVASINDAPQGTATTLTVAENGAHVFSVVDFGFADPNDSPANLLLGVTFSTVPAAGSLTAGGNPIAANQFVTLADINGGLVVFTPAANTNGLGYASLSFRVQDNGGTANGGVNEDPIARLMTINVSGVNNPPTLTAPAPQSVNEDTSLTFSTASGNSISVGDIDAGSNPVQLTLSVANGVLSLAGTAGLSFTIGTGAGDATMTFTGTVASINTALDGLSYTGNLNFNGADILSLTANDMGSTGAGGPQFANQTLAINVTAVHDVPTITIPPAQSIAEDTPLVFGAANGNAFDIIDIDGTNGLVQLTLSANNGTLTLARTTNLLLLSGTGFTDTNVTIQGRITDVNAALDGLILMPASNFNGAAAVELQFEDLSNSGGANLTLTQRVDVNVAPVNDAPTDLVRVPALTVTEGALAGTSAGTIVAIDPDDVSGFAFNLLNNGGGHFQIDPLTGALSVLGASLPAVTTQSSYTIVVQVTDSQGASIDRSLTIGVLSAAVVPTVLPSAEFGTSVTATDHGPTSNISVAATSTPEDNGQNALRRTVNVILETDSKNRRAPPHTNELKPVTVSVNGHRMLRFASDERRGDEWTTNTLITNEEAAYKRFELRSLFERLRIESMRTDDSNTRWNANSVAPTMPIDQWQWEDHQVKAYRVELETVAIGGVAMSIGLMLYAVRGAGLVAAMLTSLPAWSTLDPLVVLAKDKNSKHEWEAGGETEVEDDEQAVRAVIDEDPYDTSIQDTTIQGSTIPDRRSH